jgi:hypothetical protein
MTSIHQFFLLLLVPHLVVFRLKISPSLCKTGERSAPRKCMIDPQRLFQLTLIVSSFLFNGNYFAHFFNHLNFFVFFLIFRFNDTVSIMVVDVVHLFATQHFHRIVVNLLSRCTSSTCARDSKLTSRIGSAFTITCRLPSAIIAARFSMAYSDKD